MKKYKYEVQPIADTLIRAGFMPKPCIEGLKGCRIDNHTSKTFKTQDFANKQGISIATGTPDNFWLVGLDSDTQTPTISSEILIFLKDFFIKNLGFSKEKFIYRRGHPDKFMIIFPCENVKQQTLTTPIYFDKNGLKNQIELIGINKQIMLFGRYSLELPEKYYTWYNYFDEKIEYKEVINNLLNGRKIDYKIVLYLFKLLELKLNDFEIKNELIIVNRNVKNETNKTEIKSVIFDKDQPNKTNKNMPIKPQIKVKEIKENIEIEDELKGIKTAITLKEVKELLVLINDNETYDNWIKIGFILHNEFAGHEQALKLWKIWSYGASNFVGEKDLEKRWLEFGKSDYPEDKKLTAKSLRNFINERELELIASSKLPHTDIETGLWLARRLGNKLRRCYRYDEWYKYHEELGIWISLPESTVSYIVNKEITKLYLAVNKKYPKEVEIKEIEIDSEEIKAKLRTTFPNYSDVQLAKLVTEQIKLLKPKKKKTEFNEIQKHAKHLQSHYGTYASYAQFRICSNFDIEEFDNRRYLPFKNGVMDLEDENFKFTSHKPEYLLTRKIPVNYNLEAPEPEMYNGFTNGISRGDKGLVDFITTIGAKSMYGRPYYDPMIIMIYGPGGNGKSSLGSLWKLLFGDFCHDMGHKIIVKHINARENTSGSTDVDLYECKNRKMFLISELSNKQILDHVRCKLWTGSEQECKASARRLYAKRPEVFPIYGQIVLIANELPTILDKTDGMNRRLQFIHLTNTFTGEVNDPNLVQKIFKKEKEGIIRKYVERMQEYIRMVKADKTLEIPKSIKEYTKQMELERNPYKALFYDFFVETNSSRDILENKIILEVFQKNAEKYDLKVEDVGSKRIGKELEKFITKTRKFTNKLGIKGVGYIQIKLKNLDKNGGEE